MCDSHAKSHCQCDNSCSVLWSTAKKIRVLQQKLETIDERKAEIETLISELKAEIPKA